MFAKNSARFLFLLLGTTLLSCKEGSFSEEKKEVPSPLEKRIPVSPQEEGLREQINQSIASGLEYLTTRCHEKGSFDYRVNMDPMINVKPSYNMLRHAGTIYAMATCYPHFPNVETKEAVERAVRYLKSMLAPVPDAENTLAVWGDPKRALVSVDSRQVKLGGAGLGLVALTSAEKVIPGTTPVETLRKLGNFIVFMQKEEGSFYSKYIPKKGGRDDSWVSLYYPGEAALGLLLLHELDPDPRWFETAKKGLLYLARLRAHKKDVPHDHWALIATAQLFLQDQGDKLSEQERDELVIHGRQICRRILEVQVEDPQRQSLYGSFGSSGSIAQTATRLEGLLAALQFIPADYQELREKIEHSLDLGIAFLLQCQVKEGIYAGGFPRAVAHKKNPSGHLTQKQRAFNRRVSEIRIDYVQHALSALLGYGLLENYLTSQ